MLILTRKEDQSVVFPSCGIVVHVLSVKGRTVKLGFEAPKNIDVLRGELMSEISPPPPGRSGAKDTADTSEQIHDLKNRLNTVTLSIQLYNDLKSLGQEEAASKTLGNLLAKLSEIDRNWEVADIGSVVNKPSADSDNRLRSKESPR